MRHGGGVENFRATYREHLQGRWLFLTGDSSMRGLFIALLQQLVWRTNLSSPVLLLYNYDALSMNMSQNMTSTSVDSVPNLNPLGFVDVVLEEREDGSWAPLSMTAAKHECGAGRRRFCQVGQEQSRKLSTLWCSRRSQPRASLRLTFRQLTLLRHAKSALLQNVDAWEAARCASELQSGPDAVSFQSGLWDIDNHEDPQSVHGWLLQALTQLRMQGRRVGAVNRQLAYVSLSSPWPGRNDSHGAWQRAVVTDANEKLLTQAPQISFFDKELNHSALLSTDCLKGCSLPHHPPHAINTPLIPRMLRAWLEPKPTSAARGIDRLERFQPLEGPTCCCKSPEGLAKGSSTDYWTGMCPLVPDSSRGTDNISSGVLLKSGPNRTAFCIAGQARGFAASAVGKSIREHAIAAFGTDPDVFLVLRYGDGRTEDAMHDMELSRILTAARSMQPLRFELLPDSFGAPPMCAQWRPTHDANDASPNHTGTDRNQIWPHMHRFKMASAWRTLARSFEMVLEEEAERRSQYSFVIKLRPDEQLCRPFPQWTLFSGGRYDTSIATPRWGRAHYPNIDDHIFVAARPLADHVVAAWNEVLQCKPQSYYYATRPGCNSGRSRPANDDVFAECLIIRWLSRGGIGYDTYENGPLDMFGQLWINSTHKRSGRKNC